MAKTDKRHKSLHIAPAESRTGDPAAASGGGAAKHSTVGQDLRAAREQKNLTLRQVADETHISHRHLENLEEGRYRELPGGMYNRAFLRTYCVYLGLSPEKLVERFDRECAPVGERVVKAKPRPQEMPSEPLHIPRVLIWAAMLLISVVGLYFSRHWIKDVFSPYFSRPPVIPIASQQPEPVPQPKKEEPPPPAAAVNPPVTAQETLPTGAVDTATPPAAVAGTEIPAGIIRLQFEGVQACWLSVTGDGARLFNGTIQPGGTQTFDAKERFEVVLGNAGGLNLKINGKPAKPLGKPGAVLKLVIDKVTIPELVAK